MSNTNISTSINWEISPIIRAMLRNKVGTILIALQIAVTMTIIVNSVYIIVERSKEMQRNSGIDNENSFYLTRVGFGENFNVPVTVEEDMTALRALPGIFSLSTGLCCIKYDVAFLILRTI